MAKRVNTETFGRLLKGSDVVEAKKKAVGGVILAVRDSPEGFGSPYIIDFDTDLIGDIHSWPCNVTQSRRIADDLGTNPEKWGGCAIGLQVVQQNNPKMARQMRVDEYLVDSLAVAFTVGAKETAKKRKTKPKYKTDMVSYPGKSSGAAPPFSPVTDDDVPF